MEQLSNEDLPILENLSLLHVAPSSLHPDFSQTMEKLEKMRSQVQKSHAEQIPDYLQGITAEFIDLVKVLQTCKPKESKAYCEKRLEVLKSQMKPKRPLEQYFLDGIKAAKLDEMIPLSEIVENLEVKFASHPEREKAINILKAKLESSTVDNEISVRNLLKLSAEELKPLLGNEI